MVGRLWKDALSDIVLRHPNRQSKPVLEVTVDPGILYLGLDSTTCTVSDKVMSPFAISTVFLTFFPGVTLARQYIAAAWAGYLQHEALELCTLSNFAERPLDPHLAPYQYDRGLRDGLPPQLTPETLEKALTVVMTKEEAEKLCQLSSPSSWIWP
jgi:hypothetical protein